jgi:drug/metabolite transporter (DMT)-like permease
MSKSRAGVYFLVILAMIFWGFSFVAFKIANQSFRPITIVSFRLFVSIFFLFGFALSFKRLNKIKKKDQLWFWMMAIAEPFFYFLGEAFGLTMVTATIGAVIVSTIPLIVPFGAYYLYREKLTPMNYLGLLISFGGVLLVVLTKSNGLSASPLGILLMFVAVLSAVAYTLIVKKLAVIYLGVFGSGICFIIMALAIRELGAAKSNIFANLIPVVAAILSFFLLKEAMPLLKILGIFVVILGLLLSQISSLRANRLSRKDPFRHIPNA